MAKFRGITEAIRAQIREVAREDRSSVSPASPFAVLFGDQEPERPDGPTDDNVLRWGFSTWGIEKVTAEYKPNETLR
jgi:hypothetical protein